MDKTISERRWFRYRIAGAAILLGLSDGVGGPEHMVEALTEGRADAVLAASIFHFGTYSIREVKEHLASAGLPIRPVPGDEDRHRAGSNRQSTGV